LQTCPTKKDELVTLLGRASKKSTLFEGDLIEGELEIGQIAGGLTNLRSKPAIEIIQEMRLMMEYASIEATNFQF
jgi:enoyl-[acyl-carrier protein] reductase II